MKRLHTFLTLFTLSCGATLPPPSTNPAQPADTTPAPPGLANALLSPEQPAEPAARTVVVISDLHFGIGGTPEGQWDHYEDFRWGTELDEFLTRIDQEGNGATDLVINGDAFELWQSRTGDCRSRDADKGCGEEEALDRVRRINHAHLRELRRLGQFATTGQNRVVFVPGNHDAALMFPSVAAEVAAATGAPIDRLYVSAPGYWISRDHRVYADHGHQIGIDPNKYSSWPAPFRMYGERPYLLRPWGEQFMQAFYNAYEDRYPIIDNVTSEGDAVGFALLREGELGLIRALDSFIAFSLLKTSWKQRIEMTRLQKTSGPADSPTSREHVFKTYLGSVVDDLRGKQLATQPFDLYVLSHTHNLDTGFDVNTDGKITRVVNSGAWQRTVSKDWLLREQTKRNIPIRDVLVAFGLEDLPPCYGVVRVKPYAATERPNAEVMYWRSAPNGGSKFVKTCD
jgi:UDP-2,3-diacylglucosamine pyrophosphatase LpxH